MALIKMINVGDEVVFDLRQMSPESKEISVTVGPKGGKIVVLQIRAHKSIPVKVFKEQLIEPKIEELRFKTS